VRAPAGWIDDLISARLQSERLERWEKMPEGVVALVGGAWVICVKATSLSLSLHLI
jgi:hypothetical protein